MTPIVSVDREPVFLSAYHLDAASLQADKKRSGPRGT